MTTVQPSSSISSDTIIQSLAIPAVAATAVAAPYTMAKQWQLNSQTGGNTSLTAFKGLPSVFSQQQLRFLLRMGLVPYSTEFARENRPAWMSKETATVSATIANGVAADFLLVPTDRLAAAQQTYKGADEGKPSLRSWMKQHRLGAVPEFWSGTLPVLMRVLPFHIVLNFSRTAAHNALDPEGKNASLSTKLAEIGLATTAVTATNIALTPISLLQTLTQRHNPLNFSSAINEMGRLVKEQGVLALYRGSPARAALSAITAAGGAATLTCQEAWGARVKNRSSGI